MLSLLRFQLRMLTENRSACVVLALFFLVAFLTQFSRPSLEDETTYILYWNNDAWVENLKAALPSGNGPKIEIAHVSRFVGHDGIIQYPPGAHSIQLRPPADERGHWVIWYWYSGSDASRMQPAVDWFWHATWSHFEEDSAYQIRVSPLRGAVPLMTTVKLSVLSAMDERLWKAAIVWGALFFCACHLPALSLAQQRETETIQSLLISPPSWRGVVWSTCLFHGALAMVAAGLLAKILSANIGFPLFQLYACLVCIAHLCVAFSIGLLCRSSVSASGGVMVYLIVSGLLSGVLYFVPGLSPLSCSADFAFLGLLSNTAPPLNMLPVALSSWALVWFMVARYCLRRIQFQ